MVIRGEKERDRAGVYTVNSSAFQRLNEANLVDVLREEAEPVVSLVAEDVAEDNGGIVGHIMFSPVVLTRHPDRKVMGLGPMAVLPERQRAGVGSLSRASGTRILAILGQEDKRSAFLARCHPVPQGSSVMAVRNLGALAVPHSWRHLYGYEAIGCTPARRPLCRASNSDYGP